MSLVETDWLEKNLDKVKIIDSSWHMPQTKRNGFEEYKKLHIKNSIFFDLDKNSKLNTDLPHMLTDKNSWENIVSGMGIKNKDKIIDILNEIMRYELSGVVRYTHYALMVTGRDRLSLTQFFKEQATESLLHAQQAGELVTGLDGHPSLEISIIEESNKHNSIDLLQESATHEKNAVSLYKDFVEAVNGESIYLEEYGREMIKAEEIHSIEIQKMLKDYSN